MGYITTISISPEFKELADKYNISWTEASRVGMSIILGDMGVREYSNNINLFRKMNKFREIAEEAKQKLAELEAEQVGNNKE